MDKLPAAAVVPWYVAANDLVIFDKLAIILDEVGIKIHHIDSSSSLLQLTTYTKRLRESISCFRAVDLSSGIKLSFLSILI